MPKPKPLARAGSLWNHALAMCEKEFPDVYNLLRPVISAEVHELHDYYNLACLPVIVGWALYFIQTGSGFTTFATLTYAYFIVDCLWVILKPSCVKSPGVIVGHHVLTMLYILIPVAYPALRLYMAECLLVEVNTFFLILRRLWHVPPVSVCFYATWIGIRLVLYPYLIWEFWLLYYGQMRQGHYLHPFIFCPVFQTILTLLNIKWTMDLVKRKLKTMRDPNGKEAVEKGL